MMRARLVSILPFMVLALAVLALPLPFSAAPATREITVKAEQFAFDPPVLKVNRGDRVILNLEATDVVHGLYLDDYAIDARVEPGPICEGELLIDRLSNQDVRKAVHARPILVLPNDTGSRSSTQEFENLFDGAIRRALQLTQFEISTDDGCHA